MMKTADDKFTVKTTKLHIPQNFMCKFVDVNG